MPYNIDDTYMINPHEEYRLQNIQAGTTGMEPAPPASAPPTMPAATMPKPKTIKEYLKQIRALQASGQNVVPTFTNIQGGPMDVSQGTLAGEDVRSYVSPEYVQQGRELTRGPAHPLTKAQESLGGQAAQTSNIFDPNWANSKAIQMLPDIKAELDRAKPNHTQQDFEAAANSVRASLYKQQASEIADMKKQFPGTSGKQFFEAFQNGDMTKLINSANEMATPEFRQKKASELANEFRKIETKSSQKNEPLPTNPETGQPFQGMQEYVDHYLSQFYQTLQSITQQAVSDVTQMPETEPDTPKEFYFGLLRQGVDDAEARKQTEAKFKGKK